MTDNQSSIGKRIVKLTIAAAALNPFGSLIPANAQPFVDCTRGLQFGRILNCSSGGEIGVKPTGDLIDNGCLEALDTVKFGKCEITVSLPQTQSLQISLSQTKINMTGAGTAELGQFNLVTESGGHIYTFAPSSFTSTQKVIGIGGTMTIDPGQDGGAYSGALIMTVSFP